MVSVLLACAVTGLAVLEQRILQRDLALRTFEGVLVRLLLVAGPVLLVLRSVLHYDLSAGFGFVVSASVAGLCFGLSRLGRLDDGLRRLLEVATAAPAAAACLFGAIGLEAAGLPESAVLPAAVLPFAGILAAAETLPGLEKLKFEEAQQIANTNADLELRVDFDELNLPPGMELTDVAGSNEGLLLQGTLAPPPGAWHPAELKIVSASDEFLWRFADICDSPSYNAMATIRFRNDQNQTGAHTPLQLCRVEVIDDDDNRYGPYLQLQFDADAESGEITFEIPHSEVQTVGPGYDCKVLIVSSGGTRLITIGGFEGVSQAEVDQAMMMLKGWQLIFCRKPGIKFLLNPIKYLLNC